MGEEDGWEAETGLKNCKHAPANQETQYTDNGDPIMDRRFEYFHNTLLAPVNVDIALAVDRDDTILLKISQQLLDHLLLRSNLGQLLVIAIKGGLILLVRAWYWAT